MVEKRKEAKRLPAQDADAVRRALAFEDAMEQLFPAEISLEMLYRNVATGRIGTRIEQPPHRNITDIDHIRVDEQGSLGSGTPRPPLRIGRRGQSPTT